MNKGRAKSNSGAKDRPFSGGVKCTQAEWDRIFGKKETKAKPGRYLLVGDRLVHEDDLPPLYQAEARTSTESQAPAIHDDRTFTKSFDYGAGRKWNSRTERREWMKANGRECIG